jgi:catechol-2,3-dioxygenase
MLHMTQGISANGWRVTILPAMNRSPANSSQVSRRDVLAQMGGAWLALHLELPRRHQMTNDQPDTRPKSLHFRRVTVHTPRLEALREFYRDVLRLEFAEDERNAASFVAGSTVLRFVHDEQIQSPLYHFAFNIPENLIESCMTWTARRVELVRNPGTGNTLVHFPNWNAHSIYFWDPGGNLFEFIARHTLPNARQGGATFDSPRDVLCVSELGVVTEDVGKTDEEVTARLEISRYAAPKDGKLLNDFRAMGDEHGLFIVVRRGRRWFMTGTGAEPFPTEAVVEVDGANSAKDFSLADTGCCVSATPRKRT